jgi:hypothetical protein
MTAPRKDWTQREVVSLLLDLARQLHQLDDQLAELERDYVEKAEAYNVAHTSAFLVERQTNSSPQYVCTAVADKATHDERLAMNLAKSMVQAQKRKIEIIRERIGVGRTAASSLRAELELERVPR